MVQTKFAPKDAPKIGKGRWTCPPALLNNDELLRQIEVKGHQLQHDLDTLANERTNRRDTNPQTLWEAFKNDIKETIKTHTRTTLNKISTRIQALEKDRKELTKNPDIDEDDSLRRNEAIIAQEQEHLEKKQGRTQRNELIARLSEQGEKLGGIWSAMGKQKKPRNPIYRLRIPNVTPPQYERHSNRMAKLARDYHENLQSDNATPAQTREERARNTHNFLTIIPHDQTLRAQETQPERWVIKPDHVRHAIELAKLGSATGMDGCPYELWKHLNRRAQNPGEPTEPRIDIAKILARVFNDIQQHGVDARTNFTLGWMCPIYKKKDPTDISNYRPITLLNTDYKILTKVLALQLMEPIHAMVHPDQAGFIPGRAIADHIRLAKAIINFAELTEENGAIIALDQEKAYDKIRHDYLWETLKAFSLPEPFIRTIKALYQNAHTVVAINGILSKPFHVTRGVRQGDPLSCPLFDLAIEPLACRLRRDPKLHGIHIPGLIDKLIVKLFADDTNIYLGSRDRLDDVQDIR